MMVCTPGPFLAEEGCSLSISMHMHAVLCILGMHVSTFKLLLDLLSTHMQQMRA